MKENIFKIVSFFVLATVCVEFASCGDDDDEIVPAATPAVTPDHSSESESESDSQQEEQEDTGKESYDYIVVDGLAYKTFVDGTAEVIAKRSVDGSSKYEGNIDIPKSITLDGIYRVTSIAFAAFYDCSGLTSITIPESVTSIGDWAFDDCSGLTSIDIPNSVTSIGEYAFYKCSGLTSITIPESVTSIGYSAFAYCSGLTSVTINSNAILSKYYNRGNGLKDIFGEQVKEYVIGNDVTSIGGSAFFGCSGLTSITIPNSVTSIGWGAFEHCSGLTSITVASGNTKYDSRNNCNAIIETATNTLRQQQIPLLLDVKKLSFPTV